VLFRSPNQSTIINAGSPSTQVPVHLRTIILMWTDGGIWNSMDEMKWDRRIQMSLQSPNIQTETRMKIKGSHEFLDDIVGESSNYLGSLAPGNAGIFGDFHNKNFPDTWKMIQQRPYQV
jgi:hypothetical protein